MDVLEYVRGEMATWPDWKRQAVKQALDPQPFCIEPRTPMDEETVSFVQSNRVRERAEQAVVISPEITAAVIRALQHEIHRDNVQAGWWQDPETKEDLRDPKHLKKTLGWKFLLAHSEISEAIEGVRRNLNDDKLPHRAMVEVEIADTMIRLLDIAGAMGLDVAGAIEEKRAFNAKRSDHKMENRQAAGGKAF